MCVGVSYLDTLLHYIRCWSYSIHNVDKAKEEVLLQGIHIWDFMALMFFAVDLIPVQYFPKSTCATHYLNFASKCWRNRLILRHLLRFHEDQQEGAIGETRDVAQSIQVHVYYEP